jgi:hypothetical protein
MGCTASGIAPKPQVQPQITDPRLLPIDQRKASPRQPQHIPGMHIAMDGRLGNIGQRR